MAEAAQTQTTETDFLLNQMGGNSDEQYVTFNLGAEEYGVKILRVQEIVSLPGVTHIPNMPPYIKGLINLRGNIIPLVDLRIKFKMDSISDGKNNVVIVVQVGKRTVGMIVDKVSDVLSFTKENLQDTPEFSATIQSQYIEKIGKIGARLVILLDIEKVLSSEELQAVDKAVS